MSVVRSVVAGAMVLASVGAAEAAILTEATGAVLVNTGDGFRPAGATANLPPGSRVMARTGSRARVSYSDFCVVVVEAGQVHLVSQNSPCAAGNAPTVAGNLLPHDYAIGAGILAGGAAAAIYFATKKGDGPTSP